MGLRAVKLALLANGPSLPSKDDLARVKLPMMGMNRSWMRVPDPAYHVGVESIHYQAAPEYHDRMAAKGGLYVVGSVVPPVRRRDGGKGEFRGWPVGIALKHGSGTFSRDVFKEGVVTQLGNVGSVFYAALQVAYTLGAREVFALGLDLGGDHFDGSPASPNVAAQNSLFQWIPSDMRVLTCGSPNSNAIFEKVDFEEITH